MSPDFSDRKVLEKYSSAFTLSDMEIFIFPDLFFPLVLANIMSPEIWKWKEDEWFKNIEKKGFNRKVNRIKQYVIDNYVFNLDLATWGLTTKSREKERFRDHFDINTLKESNALFGYEGDKYYFSLDIRRHFGLDKYDNDIIPYWKTETVEAMNAFRNKPMYSTGAGECVSLAALYAAALFIVGGIDLKDIFIIATPLHSQNFIAINEGVITNNRRIVTKNMWFNGTSMSAKARRAIENEKITIVSHITGHIHTVYREATIDPERYDLFSAKLNRYLETKIDKQVFINFLRFKKYKSLFQYRDDKRGKTRYIALEKLFEYEHLSRYNVALGSRDAMLAEMDGDEFSLSPLEGRITLNDFEDILEICVGQKSCCIFKTIKESIPGLLEIVPEEMFTELGSFLKVIPRLPSCDRDYIASPYPDIKRGDSRETITKKIIDSASESEMSMLAIYAARMMDMADWTPFIKAAIERNPVAFEVFEGKDFEVVYNTIEALGNESIYSDRRLAQPDEVWNFHTGDGIEKALLMAAWMVKQNPPANLSLSISGERVKLSDGKSDYYFRSTKGFMKQVDICRGRYRCRDIS